MMAKCENCKREVDEWVWDDFSKYAFCFNCWEKKISIYPNRKPKYHRKGKEKE